MVDRRRRARRPAAESADLDALVADLPADAGRGRRPRAGWTIAHQIAHLAWTDAGRAARRHRSGRVHARRSPRRRTDPSGFVDRGAAEFLDDRRPAARPLAGGPRRARRRARGAPPDGEARRGSAPPMSPTSMATARLMETWAHGLDVADALGVARAPDRPAAAHRPPRRPDARPRVPRPRPAGARRAGPGRAAAPGRCTVDVRARRTPPTGSPARRSTSACCVTQRRHRDDLALVADRAGRRRVARRRPGVRRPARRRTRAAACRMSAIAADRQRVRLLRRPVRRLAGDARRRRRSTSSPATTSPS